MNENKLGRLMRNTGPARFFIPLGLILIIFGIILLALNAGNYVETVGTITSVTDGDYDDERQLQSYNVGFSYQANGKTYQGTFDNLSGMFKAGESIKVYYDPANPEKTVNSKAGGIIGPIMIGVGALALIFGVFKTVQAFKKSKALDEAAPAASGVDFTGFKNASGVTEYYFRRDGNSLKPGYLIEDADRKVLFEGKMLKQALVGARVFEFTDHTTGNVREHEVGHTVAQTYNDGFFTASSRFKFDGENIWDLLHDRGIRINTSLFAKFPNAAYDVARDGEPFAQIQSTGLHVHEDDAAQHNVNIPTGRGFYRCWTNTGDLETLFLVMFAITESEQAVVE